MKLLTFLYFKDTTGLWNYEEMPPPPSIHSYKPETAQIQDLNETLQPAGKIWPSLVTITFNLPYNINGLRNTSNTQVNKILICLSFLIFLIFIFTFKPFFPMIH
jgi:hypothetical protein